MFYAAARTLEENLPAADQAKQAVVIFVIRGYDQFGSTMIGVLDRYARTIQRNGGRLMLAGVSTGVVAQLERTGLLQVIGKDNVFVEQAQWGIAANQAVETAQAWLESLEPLRDGRPRERHRHARVTPGGGDTQRAADLLHLAATDSPDDLTQFGLVHREHVTQVCATRALEYHLRRRGPPRWANRGGWT